MSLRELLLGRALRSDEEDGESIGPLRGVGVLGLDALASSAYGPEAALTVLLPLGVGGIAYIAPIVGVIVGVLLAVYFSYRQTIPAYPGGGGSFTVASQNLGRVPGVLAASALALDYILNVAVAIAAGVGAIVSAAPALLPYTLLLSLCLLAFLTIVNLRGIGQAGYILMSPTWLFVAMLGITIAIGVAKTIAAGGHPQPSAPPPHVQPAMATASAWLLIRAFANGTTAMTGVEAVSNGVPLFRKPSIKYAKRTLTIIIAILVLFLIGIAYLCRAYQITATSPGQAGYQSVLSQLVAAVAGRGQFYFVVMASIFVVLCLSANTSFADFPRLCRLLALDEFLPPSFAHRGARLVFSQGIIVLSILSGILLVVFGGITDRLIPLFAIGALTAFMMSQWGMVAHWRRTRGPRWKHSMLINAVGAVATSVTIVIVLVSKFTEGAWITLLVIAAFMVLLLSRRRQAGRIDAQIADHAPIEINRPPQPIVMIPLRCLDRVARKALKLAVTLSPDVEAVQVTTEAPDRQDLTRVWDELVVGPMSHAGFTPPRLHAIKSEYREFFTPFLRYVREVVAANPHRYVAIVVPELVRRRWYHRLFRTRAMLLKALLRYRGGPHVVIIDIPWHLDE